MDVIALAIQAALVAAIYWPTYKLQFTSDAWVFLDRLRQGFWAAVATPTGYHWQPVAVAWVALLRGLFGERPAIFQAVNLAQLTLLGHLAYRLGRRVLAHAGTAFLGSLLVLGSASFYEATYWPLSGNMHLLGDDLYVLAVILAHDVARGRLGRGGPWLVGLTALAAVFSHPAMITVVPVCALTLLLVGERTDPGRSGKHRAVVLLLAVAALFGVARMAFNSAFAEGPQPGLDADRLFRLVQSGLICVFTLRGSTIYANWLMTLTALPEVGTSWTSLIVGIWMIAASAAAALLFWRVRTSGVRLLIAFFAIHLAALTLASGVTPRQCAILAVPAALLTAWAVRAVADRLAARAPTTAGAAVYHETPAALLLLLVLGAQPDHWTAARLSIRAGDAVRALVERIRAVAPPGGEQVDLMLVNMPGIMVDRGMHAHAFSNGLAELAWATSSAVGTVELRQMPGWGPPDDVPRAIRRLSPDALRMHLADPYRVVLLFESEPFGVRTVSAKDLDRFAVAQPPR